MKIIVVEVEGKCVLLNINIKMLNIYIYIYLVEHKSKLLKINVQVVEFCNIWLTICATLSCNHKQIAHKIIVLNIVIFKSMIMVELFDMSGIFTNVNLSNAKPERL